MLLAISMITVTMFTNGIGNSNWGEKEKIRKNSMDSNFLGPEIQLAIEKERECEQSFPES